MHGVFPAEYLANPHIEKPLDQVFGDINQVSWELTAKEEDPHLYGFVILPPLKKDGIRLKGILYSFAAEHILSRYPRAQNIFNFVLESRSCAIPASTQVQGLASLYPCPPREAWFRRTFPERAHQALVPIQEADWTHEYWVAPEKAFEKSYDIILVARLIENKNLPFFCRVLTTYAAKFGRKLRVAMPQIDGDWVALPDNSRQIVHAMEQELGKLEDYLELIPRMPLRDLVNLYGRSKICVHTSLLEGKSRVIHEALSCNVPVLLCRQYNRFMRPDGPLLPPAAGLEIDFDAEAFADGIHNLLQGHLQLEPRGAYLSGFSGRRHMFNSCLEHLPYYSENLPGWGQGQSHWDNLWLDLAAMDTYRLSLWALVYGGDFTQCRAFQGLDQLANLMDFYLSRFK